MIYKMTDKDYINENGEYVIWCDTFIPIDLEITNENGETKECWLKEAKYILPLDKYMATYKSYYK